MTERESRNDPQGSESTSRPLSRRAVLAGGVVAVGGAVLHTAADALSQIPGGIGFQDVPDPTKQQGVFASPRGERAPSAGLARLAAGQVSRSPLQDLEGIITPADLHFERHHAGIPRIDPTSYRLLVHGMVERPTSFSLADLKRFPQRSHLGFVECSGNGRAAYSGTDVEVTPQQVDGLLSTSEWVGVPLALILEEVGADPTATWVLAEGSDAAVMTRSIPMEKVREDALLAYGQNGEPIRPPQGFPVRLLLPGFEGNSQVKWLRRLEVGNGPWMTREETSKYTDPMPDETARMFTLAMNAKSIITFPAFPSILPEPGWWEITGLAWSGKGVIQRVEVSTDGGQSWEDATLQDPVLPRCGTRFRHLWRWDGEEVLLQSRATDETGDVQPSHDEFLAQRGPAARYHFHHIRGWRVAADGRVTYDARGV
jgi:sulfane dehydrogenase subunit SoxC